MRGINSDSIDLIYLDPPFNKGKQFHAPIGTTAQGASFHDIWSEDEVKDEWHNQLNDRFPELYQYLDATERMGNRSMKYYLIYMAVRLIEMRRILKQTGSIYLHCDPTASHYLKLLMDAIFGHENFRNEIVWKYGSGGRGAKVHAKHFPKNHDIILVYVRNRKQSFHYPVYVDRMHPLDRLPSHIRYADGHYFKTAPRGDYTDASISELRKKGRIYETRRGNLRIKYYLECDGRYVIEPAIVGSVWDDISDMMHAPSAERTRYPTQKPLRLVERIVKASCPADALVLDPFCGCATTCIAAERLDRKWVGIDVSEKAYELVKKRLDSEVMTLYEQPILRTDIPARTDIKHKMRPTKADKDFLYGKQGGNCAGCMTHFEKQHLTFDHIVPQTQGGSHELENLQLLCHNCNSIKGDRPMEYLKARQKAYRMVA